MEKKIDSIEYTVDKDGSYCVYVHTNKVNGKKYVGQTCQKPEHRWGKDGNGYLHKNKNGEYTQLLFARAIDKYGWDNFNHEIISNNLTKEEADNEERKLIEKYETMNPSKGYNSKDGGSNGKPSGEIRRKIGEKSRGRIMSDETKKKMSESHKGRKVSDETRKNMSKAQRGKKISDEQKEKLRNAAKKENLSDETIEKMRNAKLGKKFSKEHKENISDGLKRFYQSEESNELIKKKKEIMTGANNHAAKMVDQYERKTGAFIRTWDCINNVERELGICASTITGCCNNKKKSAGGYIWRHHNEPLTEEHLKWCNDKTRKRRK